MPYEIFAMSTLSEIDTQISELYKKRNKLEAKIADEIRQKYRVFYKNYYEGRRFPGGSYLDITDGGVYTSAEKAKKHVFSTDNHFFRETRKIFPEDVTDEELLKRLNRRAERWGDDR